MVAASRAAMAIGREGRIGLRGGARGGRVRGAPARGLLGVSEWPVRGHIARSGQAGDAMVLPVVDAVGMGAVRGGRARRERRPAGADIVPGARLTSFRSSGTTTGKRERSAAGQTAGH